MIPAREQNELVRLLSGCPRRRLRVGDVCCAADFCEVRLLIVERGILVLSSASTARRRIVLAFCSHGALLPPPGRDEQLRALADSVLIVLTAELQRSLLRLPAASGAIVDALIEAVSQRQESLAQFANVAHSERLRGKLLQLARAHGTVLADGIRLELPLTHELLGQAIGSARETVTWALKALEGEGFLVRDGRRYRLVPQTSALTSRRPRATASSRPDPPR